MNIVIPMAGLGSRFSEYDIPKPLIDINGRPMIVSAMQSMNLDGNYIFIIQKDHCNNYCLDSLLKFYFPQCILIVIDYITSGPASSVLLAKNYIDNNDELVVANCDQIMHWDSDIFLKVARNYDGCLVTYHTEVPHNSYVRIDNYGYVEEVKEKQVISKISTTGIHYWKYGKDFVESSELMIYNKDTAPNGEFYVAPTYNYMINEMQKVIGIYHLADGQHNPVGIPSDLKIFLEK